MNKQSKKSQPSQEDLKRLRGQDLVVDFLVRERIPVTRRNYLIANYGDPDYDKTEDWGGELEAELPEFLQEE